MINTYDCYVPNKRIEGNQYTIVWYVDNNKALHVNLKVIDDIISDLKVNLGYLVIATGEKY